MQQYFIKWKMHVMFYSSIDFYKTLENKKKKEMLNNFISSVCVKKI